MKNKFLFLSVIIFITAMSNAFSQRHKNPENVVNVHFFGLFMGHYQLKYERVLSDNSSVALNVGLMPKKNLPESMNPVTYADRYFQPYLSGWFMTPEYRYYPGSKGAPYGLYIAPYLKIDKYTVVYNEELESQSGKISDFTVNGSIGQFGGGISLGTQWLIGRRFSIDWYFVALGITRRSLTMLYEPREEGLDLADYEDSVDFSNSDLENTPIARNVVKNMSVTSDSDDIKLKAPFVTVGSRWGITLGWAF